MKDALRIIVGVIFIISGFVKTIDARGFSFKLEEYFSPSVFNLSLLETYALPLAIFVAIFEILLGLALVIKLCLKKSLALLIALCVFFAFLTFYSAYFDKVTDCGCFGDAIKFTPWQSFWKDIILLVGLLILWIGYRKEKEQKNKLALARFFIGLLGTITITSAGIYGEPLIDFRDYKIGTDLNAERKKIEKNPAEYKTYYTLKNNKTGEEKEVNQDDYVNKQEYWEEGTPWEIIEDKTISKLVKEGYKSEISKFKLSDKDENDATEEILNKEKVILIFSYNPKEIKDYSAKISELKKKNSEIYGVSPEGDTFKGLTNFSMDGTAIKTIARSNPFVLVLEKGKIVDKQPLKNY